MRRKPRLTDACMEGLSLRGSFWPTVLLLVVICSEIMVGASTATGPFREQEILAGQNGTVLRFPIIAKSRAIGSGPIYGVNFISSPEDPADAQQYQNGLDTGASFNRWPMYWHSVEASRGVYDWSRVDPVVTNDLANGLDINAILLGTPGFYATVLETDGEPARPDQRGPFKMTAVQAATPEGLYSAIFSDGSDIPGPGKQINTDNVWARYVFAAVDRYRPDGVMSKAEDWPAGWGIRYWEMWNEPDLPWFWDSSLEDYARLLKVGYLAAKHADPRAQVLFGALANNSEWLSYYDEVLDIYDSDKASPASAYFHDIVATHSYFYAWQSWFHVFRAANVMGDHGLDKPIWLNESGVPAWDDYPGPTWDEKSSLRATTVEGSHFVIQSAFYATFAGADAIYHFQLYDGCGNQPQGSDFPPHNGELCGPDPLDPVCAGDANGLFSNPPDAACFTQHPAPETPRPNFKAFQLLTEYLTGVEPLWRQRPGGSTLSNGPQEWIAFSRPETGERIVGMWARFGNDEVAELEAIAHQALMVLPDGTRQVIYPIDGVYRIPLPAATNQNAFWDETLYAIGGRPAMIIEETG